VGEAHGERGDSASARRGFRACDHESRYDSGWYDSGRYDGGWNDGGRNHDACANHDEEC
jgi:hypothetical protein